MSEPIVTKQLRSFGLIVGGVFALLGLWPVLWRSNEPRLWALALAVLLVIPALLWPRSLAPLYRIWMRVGHILGWINTRIILSVIFYGVFAPVGSILRLRNKDPMHRKLEPESETYRIVRQPRPSSHMARQF